MIYLNILNFINKNSKSIYIGILLYTQLKVVDKLVNSITIRKRKYGSFITNLIDTMPCLDRLSKDKKFSFYLFLKFSKKFYTCSSISF